MGGVISPINRANAPQKYVRRKYDFKSGVRGRATLMTPARDQSRSQNTPQKNKQLGVQAMTVTMTSPASTAVARLWD
jgi:hypothetical protein